MATTPEFHADLAPLEVLLGTWSGTGSGTYPTIEAFSYQEEITFGHVGKPFLAYSQKTRQPVTGLPMHAETGYWRPTGPAGGPGGHAGTSLEVVLAHPTGILELLVGSIAPGDGGTVIDLRSASMLGSPTAKPVTEVHRRFEIAADGRSLRYALAMAAVGQPLTHHLSAELQRS